MAMHLPKPQDSRKAQLSLGLTTLANTVGGIARGKVIALVSGQNGLGLYSQLGTTLEAASTILLLGTPTGSLTELSRAAGANNIVAFARVMATSMLMAITLGALGSALVALLSQELAELALGESELWWMVSVASPCVFFTSLLGHYNATIEASQQFRRLAQMRLTSAILTPAFSITPIAIWGRAAIPTAILLASASTALVAITFNRKIINQIKNSVEARRSMPIARSVAKTGLSTAIESSSSVIARFLTRSFLVSAVGIDFLGQAAAAITIQGLSLVTIWTITSSAFFPRMCAAANSTSARNTTIRRQLILAYGATCLVGPAWIICGDWLLVTLYSDDFATSHNLLTALGFYLTIQVLADSLRYAVLGLGLRRAYSSIGLLAGIAYATVTILSYQDLGLLALAAGPIASASVQSLAATWIIRGRVAKKTLLVSTVLILASIATALGFIFMTTLSVQF